MRCASNPGYFENARAILSVWVKSPVAMTGGVMLLLCRLVGDDRWEVRYV